MPVWTEPTFWISGEKMKSYPIVPIMSCSFSKVSEKKIAYIFLSTFHIACSICFLNLPHRDNLIHSVYKVSHLVSFGVLLS